ncbi:response regulator transcription factor [Nostoc sp. CHAB 5784]|uniref:LuxR C-terminal-related transcriptional regulator n=1 Tax=Nostoc mirabile TaxID=2907820 RepID=UPI001E5BC34B|nr:response regulator transcription factor [Nostoc mirabile]MCC5670426.1 response regulator transcription factor [Nostoc mirabile CHAB5784]
MKKTIQVLLAEKNPLMRGSIRNTLTLKKDLKLVGEATNGYKAQRLSVELRPDVLLFDPNMSSSTLSKIITDLHEQCPEEKVLILTTHDINMHNLVPSGVAGCIFKEEEPMSLVSAIRNVMQGNVWLSQTVLQRLVQWKTDPVQTQEPTLTTQEKQILSMIALGWNNICIAAELCLAKQTVRNYISRIYSKLTVSSRSEAIVWAIKHGYTQK